jgi:hypothetical protein
MPALTPSFPRRHLATVVGLGVAILLLLGVLAVAGTVIGESLTSTGTTTGAAPQP